MTEEEWLNGSNGQEMLNKMEHDAISERKARLFAAACCRTVWKQLGRSGRKVTELAELYADGFSGNMAVPLVGRLLGWMSGLNQRRRLNSLLRSAESEFGHALLQWVLMDMEYGALVFAYMLADDANDVGVAFDVQAQLVRDIVGNPFQPVSVDPAWLTRTIAALAQAIYDERAFDRLPILADALEEIGCTNQKILQHCRTSEKHVRGCWVVDAILARK